MSMHTYVVHKEYKVRIGSNIKADSREEAKNILDKRVEALIKSTKKDDLRTAWYHYTGYTKL